jgi:peptidyl-dipeptidase A
LENDIRSLQSIEPNARWFFTANHELGHGYYFKAYSRPEVSLFATDRRCTLDFMKVLAS